MGKRNRLMSSRREIRLSLEELNPIRALAFCFLKAMLAEQNGPAYAIEWMRDYCCMTEKEAAESIAIGRRVTARSP